MTRFVIKWPSTQIGPQRLDSLVATLIVPSLRLISYLRSLPDSLVQEYMDEVRRTPVSQS